MGENEETQEGIQRPSSEEGATVDGLRPTALFIVGAGASGKYAIGKAIAEKLGPNWALAHNHQAIELAYTMFPGQNEDAELDWALIGAIREAVRDHLIYSKKNVIHTYVVRDMPIDSMHMRLQVQDYANAGYRVALLALNAPLDVRLMRNSGKDRLSAKPSKKDVKRSRDLLLKEKEQDVIDEWNREAVSRMFGENAPIDAALVIDTCAMAAEEAAEKAIEGLRLAIWKS